MHVRVDEKMNLTCGKDGGVQSLEVLGVLYVNIATEEDAKIKIALTNNDSRNLQLQVKLQAYSNTDQNMTKVLYQQNKTNYDKTEYWSDA